MTRVAILWHMHQPFYEDLVTARAHPAVGPAARPEGLLRDGGAAAGVSRTSASPSTSCRRCSCSSRRLPTDRARDRFLELSLKPAADLDRRPTSTFILENFFHAQRQRMIDVVSAVRGAAGAARRLAADRRPTRERRRAGSPRRPARPAGLAQAGLDRSVLSRRRRAGARPGGEGPRLHRRGQGAAARRSSSSS